MQMIRCALADSSYSRSADNFMPEIGLDWAERVYPVASFQDRSEVIVGLILDCAELGVFVKLLPPH